MTISFIGGGTKSKAAPQRIGFVRSAGAGKGAKASSSRWRRWASSRSRWTPPFVNDWRGANWISHTMSDRTVPPCTAAGAGVTGAVVAIRAGTEPDVGGSIRFTIKACVWQQVAIGGGLIAKLSSVAFIDQWCFMHVFHHPPQRRPARSSLARLG
jgi:hypothetical protein